MYGGHADHPQPFTEDEIPRPAASFHYEQNKVRAEKMIVDRYSLEAVLPEMLKLYEQTAAMKLPAWELPPPMRMPPSLTSTVW